MKNIVINKPEYTVKMLKDGTIQTEYRHTANDYLVNIAYGVGGALLGIFTLYQIVQAMIPFAK